MYNKMILNIDLLCFIVIFFETISALPYRRFRRHINLRQNDASFYEPRSVLSKAVSGSIVGTAYYGIGSDPNYGSFIAKPNSANGGGIVPISYNPDSSLFGTLINPNYNHLKPQQQHNYMYSNNYNPNYAWQRPNNNNNPFYNRYEPGNQGWYATGGDYWYNKGQSVTAHPCLLLITVAILIFANKK